MAALADVLRSKGTEVVSVHADDSAFDAIHVMNERGIGSVMVMERGVLLGVISERDIARKVALQEKSLRTTPAREIMTAEVVSVSPETTVEQAMAIMTDKRVRHLPVRNESGVVGVISIGDLVKAVIDAQAEQIEHLERYITG